MQNKLNCHVPEILVRTVQLHNISFIPTKHLLLEHY